MEELFVATILVLEDDIELNQTITYAMEKQGYQVFSAYSCKADKYFSLTTAFLYLH